jgi:CRP-like cAMP-binding protein
LTCRHAPQCNALSDTARASRQRFGRDTGDGIEVERPVSQEQLADWCGASREATVKALGSLRALGCIATGRRSVLIRDLEALRRHAYGAAL